MSIPTAFLHVDIFDMYLITHPFPHPTSKNENNKENFVCTDIETWKYTGKFDYVFAMESIYYSDSIEKAIKKIFKLVKPGGKFFCGTDFYTENKATIKWANIMKIQILSTLFLNVNAFEFS